MKALSIITEKVDFLDNSLSQFNPQLSKIEFIGTISVFSFFFESEKELDENWERITNSIAVYYQSEFEDETREFERWNIYILFLIKESVSTQLKYKIENDKFSSRKIIQDNISDSNSISELISKHVINNDIDISIIDNNTDNINPTYSNDSKIYGLVESSNLKISGRGTNKNELDNLYQQIIKEVKNEI
jgi:hypothetical protein